MCNVKFHHNKHYADLVLIASTARENPTELLTTKSPPELFDDSYKSVAQSPFTQWALFLKYKTLYEHIQAEFNVFNQKDGRHMGVVEISHDIWKVLKSISNTHLARKPYN
jgi:hypothetical protein